MTNKETNKYTGKVALWENKLKKNKKNFSQKSHFNCTALLVSSIQAIGITWCQTCFVLGLDTNIPKNALKIYPEILNFSLKIPPKIIVRL